MIYTVEEYASMWDNATRAGNVKERILRNEGFNTYFSNEIIGKDINLADISKKAKVTVDYLVGQNYINKSDSVLDIGSGVGAYSIQFADNVNIVTALDMSEVSLEVLNDYCKTHKIQNVKSVCSMWETYSSKEKFDFVFTSMCPAICNYDELCRMERLAKKYCAILTVSKGSGSTNRGELRRLITNEKLKGLSTESIYIYNTLYSMGRQPEVKTYDESYSTSMEAEKAKTKYKQYFSIFGYVGENVDKIIYDFVDKKSVNGILTDKTTLNTALIIWKI